MAAQKKAYPLRISGDVLDASSAGPKSCVLCGERGTRQIFNTGTLHNQRRIPWSLLRSS